MEAIVSDIVKELPSTGILILFVWFVGKQFDVALKLLADHLEQLNKLIESCMERKKNDEEMLKVRFDDDVEKKFDDLLHYIRTQESR